MTTLPRLRQSVRVIGAIASKDVVDAIRNKTTLSIVVSMLAMILLYRLLPEWESGGLIPRLAVYDENRSDWLLQLEGSQEFDLFLADSTQQMMAYLAGRDRVVLGTVLPVDLDEQLASNVAISLDGYVVHWASAAKAAEVRDFFEGALSRLAGKPVRFDPSGHTVYTQKSSRGYALLAAMGVVFGVAMVGISLVPQLILEEKRTRTLDALVVSPASYAQITTGKALAGVSYCLVGSLVALAVNHSLVTHWGLALAVTIAGSCFSVAVGLLLGITLEDRGKLTLWAWVLFIPLLIAPFLAIAEGLVPAGLISALQPIPTVAMSKALRVAFSDSAPLSAFGPELLLILGWATPPIGAVAWKLKRAYR
jgi:ABC-2 type transport system permease protein